MSRRSARIAWTSLTVASLAGGVAPSANAQSRVLAVDGVRIHYTVTGSGPGVVLLHGWALDLREWTDQIAARSPRFTVIAIDRAASMPERVTARSLWWPAAGRVSDVHARR